MGVLEEEREQLELSIRQNDLFPLVAQHAAVRIEPQPLELPDSLIPEVKTCVISLHLGLDVGDIDVGRLLRHGVELGQLSLDPFQEAKFEADQIVIDAHPMASVLPMVGVDVLAFERALGWNLWMPGLHGYHYTDPVESVCC